MNRIKKYQFLINTFLVICAILIIMFRLIDMRKPKSIEIDKENIKDEKIPTLTENTTIDFNKLRKKYDNNDIIGAIRIENDGFEEVIFQSKDNEYYLKHNYRGKKSNGEVFIDSKLDIDNSDIKVIYTEGSSKSDIFKNFYNKEYSKQHSIIEIETDKLVYKYEVLSLIEEKISYKDFDIKKIKENSIYFINDINDDKNEYLVIVNKADKKYYSIICKKVK